jgi:hypothetical protein
MREADLERRVRRLVGSVIEGVRYHTLRDPPRLRSADCHGVDGAVFLKLRGGSFVRIHGADELGLHHGYSVTLEERRRADPESGGLAEVTDEPPWPDYVGAAVVKTLVRWECLRLEDLRPNLRAMVAVRADYLRRSDYPQWLELEFDNGRKLFFSAARIGEGGEFIPLAKDVMVCFSEDRLPRPSFTGR